MCIKMEDTKQACYGPTSFIAYVWQEPPATRTQEMAAVKYGVAYSGCVLAESVGDFWGKLKSGKK
jgi:hypothetical protein